MAASPLTPAEFQAATGVSRETLDRLTLLADLLKKWQPRINLIGSDTLADLWRRHMLDSAQLAPLVPRSARTLIDLGSGAGFPGLVLAAVSPALQVHLVEANARKCAFLRQAAAAMGLPVTIHPRRIEQMAPQPFDVVTALALAPLARLLGLAERFVGPGTLCLFLKGRGVEGELIEAQKTWRMVVRRRPSLSDPAGTILDVGAIARERLA
jgi:16S rRNA (guanine527-N7)-methyltransferase